MQLLQTILGDKLSAIAASGVIIPPPKGTVSKGDSLTIGNGLADEYPADLSRIVGIPRIQNYGVGGQTCSTANTNYASEGGSGVFNALTADTYLFMMGTNDAVNTDDVTLRGRIQTHINLALATGYRVAIGTITKRNDSPNGATAQAVLNPLNSYIRANYKAMGATWLMDFDAWPTLQNPNDTTYYNADKLHFNTAGWLEMAKCAQAGLGLAALSARGSNGALRFRPNPPGFRTTGAIPTITVSEMQNVTLGNGSIAGLVNPIVDKSAFAFSFVSGVTSFTNVGVYTAADVDVNIGFGTAGIGGAGYYQNAGVFVGGSSPNSGLGGFTNGDTIGCIVDPTAKQIWWTKDGTNFIGIGSLATLAQVIAGTNSTAQTWTGPISAVLGLWGASGVVANSVVYPWTLPTGYTQL